MALAFHYTGWAGLFLLAVFAPLIAFPFLVLRLLLGFRVGSYRHDLTEETLWRTSGKPSVTKGEITVAGRTLQPQLDRAEIRMALAGLPWAAADHGASGSVVYAIRDGEGRQFYKLKSGGRKTIWLWSVAVVAVVWSVVVSLAAWWIVNGMRTNAVASMAQAEQNQAALAAAPQCTGSVGNGKSCVLLLDGVITSETDTGGTFGNACQMVVNQSAHAYTFTTDADCTAVPATGTTVGFQVWDGAVVEMEAGVKRFETYDNPAKVYVGSKVTRDSADSFGWAWLVAPLTYSFVLWVGHLAWRRGQAKRRITYGTASQASPAVPQVKT